MPRRLHLPASSVLVLSLAVFPLPAQRADSAASARAHFAAAGRALAAGDTRMALQRADSATLVWPRQPAYALATARLAAVAGDRSRALAHLARAVAMGHAFDPAHAAFATLRTDTSFERLADRGRALVAPRVASTVVHRLADRAFHAEGVAHDPGTGRLFVSSARHGTVLALDSLGVATPFIPASTGWPGAFGMAVDTARGVLWVAVSPSGLARDSSAVRDWRAAVVGVDLRTGAERERWTLADTTAAHQLGDVTLADDGSVWTADAAAPGVYRIEPDGRGGALAAPAFRSPHWASPQGIAVAPGGGEAWLADWTTGLYHLDRRTGAVTPVAATPEQNVLGVDGLLWRAEGTLVAIQNGTVPPRVVAITLRESGRAVAAVTLLDRHLPLAEEPTLGVVVGDALVYVANAPWRHYAAGVPRDESALPHPLLLRLPLPPRAAPVSGPPQ